MEHQQIQTDHREHRGQVPQVHGHRPAGQPGDRPSSGTAGPPLDRGARQEDRAHLRDGLRHDGSRRRAQVRHRLARHADHAERVRTHGDQHDHRGEGQHQPGPQRGGPRAGGAARGTLVGVREPGQERHGPDEQHVGPAEGLQAGAEPQHVHGQRQGDRHGQRPAAPPPPGAQQQRCDADEGEPDEQEPQRLRGHGRHPPERAGRHPGALQCGDRDDPHHGQRGHGARQTSDPPTERAGPAGARHARHPGRGGCARLVVPGRCARGEEQQRQHLQHPGEGPRRAVRQGVAHVQRRAVPGRVGHQPVQRDHRDGAEGPYRVDEGVASGGARCAGGLCRRARCGTDQDGGHGRLPGSADDAVPAL